MRNVESAAVVATAGGDICESASGEAVQHEALEGEPPTGVLGEEATRVKVPRVPPTPTQAEVQEHTLSGHAAYRSWCPHCVRGRGTNNHHATVAKEAVAEVPTVSFDY